ncbi:hypothetical protein B0H10DRAFT_2103807 [Mycena sp. CBHHK59/15]|nr:hypothetical protein B0H10DRAFT_2103807 [Mycena sp. CBHHK59/15]
MSCAHVQGLTRSEYSPAVLCRACAIIRPTSSVPVRCQVDSAHCSSGNSQLRRLKSAGRDIKAARGLGE